MVDILAKKNIVSTHAVTGQHTVSCRTTSNIVLWEL